VNVQEKKPEKQPKKLPLLKVETVRDLRPGHTGANVATTEAHRGPGSIPTTTITHRSRGE